MKNTAVGLYGLVALAVFANTIAMGLVLGVAVINEVKLINHIQLESLIRFAPQVHLTNGTQACK